MQMIFSYLDLNLIIIGIFFMMPSPMNLQKLLPQVPSKKNKTQKLSEGLIMTAEKMNLVKKQNYYKNFFLFIMNNFRNMIILLKMSSYIFFYLKKSVTINRLFWVLHLQIYEDYFFFESLYSLYMLNLFITDWRLKFLFKVNYKPGVDIIFSNYIFLFVKMLFKFNFSYWSVSKFFFDFQQLQSKKKCLVMC